MANVNSTVIRLKGLGFLAAVMLAVVLSTPGLAASPEKKLNTDLQGVAIKGYDTVAYFIEGRAVKGKKEFEYEWQGAKWRFANASNRDRFAADPQAYAPKYGGF